MLESRWSIDWMDWRLEGFKPRWMVDLVEVCLEVRAESGRDLGRRARQERFLEWRYLEAFKLELRFEDLCFVIVDSEAILYLNLN